MAELPTSRQTNSVNAALAIPNLPIQPASTGKDAFDSFKDVAATSRSLINDAVVRPYELKTQRERDEQQKKLGDIQIQKAEQDLALSKTEAKAQMDYLESLSSSPVTGSGSPAQTVPPPPPGVDPFEWRKAWTNILAEEQSPERKRELAAKAEQEATTAGFALRDVDEAMDRLLNSADNPILRIGKAYSVPESNEYELRRAIESLRGTIAIDQLLNIKQQGAGLGQVPQSQLNMLSVLLGTLDLGLSKETLQGKLEDIKTQYSDILNKMTPEDRSLVGVAVRELDEINQEKEVRVPEGETAEGLPVVNSLEEYNKLNLKPGDRYIYNGQIAVKQ